MNWDLEKISNYINVLQKKINNTTDSNELMALKYDYEILVFLLNDFNRKSRCSHNDIKDYKELYSPFLSSSASSLINKKQELLEIAFKMQSLHFCPIKRRPYFLPQNDFYQMLLEFIRNFSSDLCREYQNLCDGNILAMRKGPALKDANGLCFYLHTLRDSFIVFNDNPRKSLSILIHELAHVSDFKEIMDFKRNLNYHFSIFVESYPQFMELVFLDYYKDSDYGTWFLYQMREKLLNLRFMSGEYYLGFLGRMDRYDPNLNEVVTTDGLRTKKRNIDNIVSQIMAFYLFYLYCNNPGLLEEIIKKYHSLIGLNDEFIWELFKDIDILEVWDWFSDYFNQRVGSLGLKKVMVK